MYVLLVIQGDVPSAWYPYMQESVSRSRVRQGLPFRVYSCWNGAVVLPGEVLVKVPRQAPSTHRPPKLCIVPLTHREGMVGHAVLILYPTEQDCVSIMAARGANVAACLGPCDAHL